MVYILQYIRIKPRTEREFSSVPIKSAKGSLTLKALEPPRGHLFITSRAYARARTLLTETERARTSSILVSSLPTG